MPNTSRATNAHTKGGSKQTARNEPRHARRLGSEGRGHSRKGRNRPDNQGRMEQGSNKAGSGQGATKN